MYEISPVLELIFNAEEISALKDAYQAKAQRDMQAAVDLQAAHEDDNDKEPLQ